MLRNVYKKIISGILIISIIFPSVFLALPKKADAVFGVGDVVIDPNNLVENTITAANTTQLAFNSYSLQLKEYVLDGLAVALAKQVIRQITASVVNWINSGFKGSPSFIQDPSSFFLDVADQITGDFLAKAGGPLTALCSQFSIDIRLSLAFKYHPNIPRRYECTLSKIIKNTANAVEGASINGFTAGDFSQGGWQSFVSMTTEPQNNAIGAYLTADSDLSIRVADARLQQRDELNQGRGFLSWKKCSSTSSSQEGSGQASSGTSGQKCEIQTPGAVIESTLEENVNGPLHELQLADEINEIVNALFAQLITQVLTKGLGAVSGGGASDSSAYINQIQNEATLGSAQMDSVRSELIKNVDTYLGNADAYRNNKNQSLNFAIDTKNAYESVKQCYVNKITGNVPALTEGQKSVANNRINEIQKIIDEEIKPLADSLLNGAKQADNAYSDLLYIKDKAISANTVQDLNIPSVQYSDMLRSQSLKTAADIQSSQQELEDTQSKLTPLKQDAIRRYQECQIFPPGTSSSQNTTI